MEQQRNMRLQEFNKFDIERILKEVINELNNENDRIIEFIDQNGNVLDSATTSSFLEEAANNAAQVVRISSMLFYKDDIYNFFSSGPLIRKEDVQL